MNGSKGNAAFNASEQPERRDIVLNLNTAHRMLPLVQHIVGDILADQAVLQRLQPEQDRLDRHKRELVWQERQRRYQVHEEVSSAERHLLEAREELDTLGIALLDAEIGRVGFPTLVNDRRAFFSWKPGEETLNTWQFEEETICRPIPASWWKITETSMTGTN
jgi:hypothetical protein